MTLNEAMEILGQNEGFRATVYAMNTLLIKKGIYSTAEFEKLFIEHAINYQRDFRGKDQTVSRAVAHASL